jgi:hypothetical protein
MDLEQLKQFVAGVLLETEGKKLTFAALKEKARISRGLTSLLDRMKADGIVNYELGDAGMTDDTIISLAGR